MLFATTRLQEVIYPDQEVINALLAISDEADAELQRAVAHTLQLIKERQN